MNWEYKLNAFLTDFEHLTDIDGILVCGSYITGNPSNHSDLDVHIILKNDVDYRERGNKVVDGLLIEYFANPPKQIMKYFEDDLEDKSLMSQVQFATGKIIKENNEVVKSLKEMALTMINDFYMNDNQRMSELTKYGCWDMLDNLQDAFENHKKDFDFLYFNFLNGLIKNYMLSINRPYVLNAIFGNITCSVVRDKYLLRELPDVNIRELIVKCIKAVDRNEKMNSYQCLTNEILNKFGGFDIGKFKFKSNIEI